MNYSFRASALRASRILLRPARGTMQAHEGDAGVVTPVPSSPSDASKPLLDTFRRMHTYLRVSLTERCNLRCVYCMPEQGIELSAAENILTRAEFTRLINLFARLGVTKVRLTGGEPLVYRELIDLCGDIKQANNGSIKHLGITTNAVTLSRSLPRLHENGVNIINISLDTLKPERYQLMTRRNAFDKVIKGIETAEALGFSPVKINCVVMRGVNDDEIPDFAALTAKRNLQVRFIEYMPFDENNWSRRKMFNFMEMVDVIEAANGGKKLIPQGSSETAKLFKVSKDHRGSVGFISSMTSHFCGTCNRLRITADGKLKVCLFGEDETDLKTPLRAGATDDELTTIIANAVSAKHFSHGGKKSPEGIAEIRNRPMIKIGG